MSNTFLKDLSKDLKNSVTVQINDVRGKTYLMRPFTVEDDKNIMLTDTFNKDNPLLVLKAIRKVLLACNMDGRLTEEDLDAYSVQYMFLQLRAKSKGENVRVVVTCPDIACQNDIDVQRIEWEEQNSGNEGLTFIPKNEKTLVIKLTDIEFKDNGIGNNITFNLLNGNPITFVMRRPDENDLFSLDEKHKRMGEKYGDFEQLLDLVSHCITEIHYNDSFQDTRNIDPKEIKESVLCNLTTDAVLENFTPFLENIPEFETEIEWTCDNCHQHHKQTLKGLDNFLV